MEEARQLTHHRLVERSFGVLYVSVVWLEGILLKSSLSWLRLTTISNRGVRLSLN